MLIRTTVIAVLPLLAASESFACAFHGPGEGAAEAAAVADADHLDWRDAEATSLRNHVQLTFSDRFVKAGEAYFSPDGRRIIFQAVEQPEDGGEPDEFYAMFVAEVERDGDREGAITGLANVTRVSPEGSANTCGWFHPTDRDVVIFGSTIGAPSESTPPGYQRATGRYRWMFPPEMKIVRVDLREADGTAGPLEVLVDDGAYAAEGSISPDGRHLLYCSLKTGQGDLYVKDLRTGRSTRVVGAEGYDGGPFFSPDATRICYRSDRRGDNLLQLFVADLAFDDTGRIVGIEREYQLTDDEHVNWCPFWHPGGRHLVYATSEIGHHNYEVFIVDADDGRQSGSTGPVKYGTRTRRITAAGGFDGLPVFNADGSTMMWTSQRGDGSSQLWAADFVFDLDGRDGAGDDEADRDTATINVTDPVTGIVYMYNPRTHELKAYDPETHSVREATAEEQEIAMRLFRARETDGRE